MSRHQPVCTMPVRVLSRSFFNPDVLYNQENEKELLASMDIDHPVRNSTNSDTAAKRTAHEQNTELPVSVVFPVCNQNLLRKQKIPVARSLKPKLKSYETNLRVKIVSLVS